MILNVTHHFLVPTVYPAHKFTQNPRTFQVTMLTDKKPQNLSALLKLTSQKPDQKIYEAYHHTSYIRCIQGCMLTTIIVIINRQCLPIGCCSIASNPQLIHISLAVNVTYITQLSQPRSDSHCCGDLWQPTYNSQLGLAAQSRPGIGELDQSIAGQQSYLTVAGTALLYCSTLTDHSHSQPHVWPVSTQRYQQVNLMMT